MSNYFVNSSRFRYGFRRRKPFYASSNCVPASFVLTSGIERTVVQSLVKVKDAPSSILLPRNELKKCMPLLVQSTFIRVTGIKPVCKVFNINFHFQVEIFITSFAFTFPNIHNES